MAMLNVKQAAERAGVSPALVYEWCDEKRLTHYRCGAKGRRGVIRIDEPDLAAFLETLKVRPDVSLPEGLLHIQQRA